VTELRLITPDVYAWIADTPGHDHPNAGVVIEPDGATIIDTLLVASQGECLAAAIEPFGVPVRRAVYTSSHVAAVGGSAVFWMAARYGRSQTSALLEQPANVDALARLHPSYAAELSTLTESPTRPVSHTVDVAAWLTPKVCALPFSGHQQENLVALVPDADTLFAGSLCCFGVTPNVFDGNPEVWADTLGDLAELATTIVPGIGPVGSSHDVVALQAYLYACVDAAADASGIPPGPWDQWTNRDLDEVNIERASMLARGDAGVPSSMLRRLGIT